MIIKEDFFDTNIDLPDDIDDNSSGFENDSISDNKIKETCQYYFKISFYRDAYQKYKNNFIGFMTNLQKCYSSCFEDFLIDVDDDAYDLNFYFNLSKKLNTYALYKFCQILGKLFYKNFPAFTQLVDFKNIMLMIPETSTRHPQYLEKFLSEDSEIGALMYFFSHSNDYFNFLSESKKQALYKEYHNDFKNINFDVDQLHNAILYEDFSTSVWIFLPLYKVCFNNAKFSRHSGIYLSSNPKPEFISIDGKITTKLIEEQTKDLPYSVQTKDKIVSNRQFHSILIKWKWYKGIIQIPTFRNRAPDFSRMIPGIAIKVYLEDKNELI